MILDSGYVFGPPCNIMFYKARLTVSQVSTHEFHALMSAN